GDLLHRALHAAFELNRELSPSVPVNERLARAREAAERACSLDAAGSPIRRDGRARAVNDAIEVLRQDLEGDGAFVYRDGERPFNRYQAPPWGPLVLRGPRGQEVFVEGRLDRLDVSRDGSAIRVVDYKSGAGKARKIGETDFQVPLYALVAKRQGAGRTLGVYASVGQGGLVTMRPRKESDQELDLDPIALTAAGAVERVWSGAVAPRPRSPRVCDHCNARGLCRRPAVVPADDDPFGEQG
ncbi:MAG: PD-(D/E)XK nuclease family protein, partial [Myxococcales bacterium]|nr:PD-(D/E)XK nuclease family protein [Myxococcales bacterium]